MPLKNKISMFLRTIFPDRIPEFSINDMDDPACYIYIIDNEAMLLHAKPNMQDGEVLKVGFINNELVFYPLDSKFFKNRFELRTFELIELITCANLHIIGEKVCSEIEYFRAKILEHKEVYAKKFQNIQFSINIIDKTRILNLNTDIESALKTAVEGELLKIMRENMIDKKLNLFAMLYPEGIYNIAGFMQNPPSISTGTINKYLNQSELADSELRSAEININETIFVVYFYIKSLTLQSSLSKKIYANAELAIKNIDVFNLQPNEMMYENDDISTLIYPNEIIIVNKGASEAKITNFKSSFECGEPPSALLEIDEIIQIPGNHNVSFEPDRNANFIKNLSSELVANNRLKHHLSVEYEINGEGKKFMSNGTYEPIDVIREKKLDLGVQDSELDSDSNAQDSNLNQDSD